MAEPLHNATQETKDNLGDQGLTAQILLRKQEEIESDEGPSKYLSTDIGDMFILSHPVNGVLGTANGQAGTQITLGRGKEGETTLSAVTNPSNRFRLFLRSIETDAYSVTSPTQMGFVNTGSTTATVSTVNYDINFTSGEIFQTEVIAFSSGTDITNARVVLPTNDLDGSDTVQLSADNGSNFETVTVGTNHQFTNTGEKLILKITAGGTREISVRDTDGNDTPIEVYYNENI